MHLLAILPPTHTHPAQFLVPPDSSSFSSFTRYVLPLIAAAGAMIGTSNKPKLNLTDRLS